MSPISCATQFPATVQQLDNGLSVIHQQMPATPVAVVDVWVRAGAIAEPDHWSGMAHFLEHMIFKGTDLVPPGYFDWAIENQGGTSNAATSYDYAHYFIATSREQLPETLPYLAEIVLHAAIPDEEFERERDVVLEEIRQSYDDPDQLGYQALAESVYQYHPYGRPILGTEAQLMANSPEAMRQFHRTHYQPENMTVVVVGGLEQEEALDLARDAFSEFAPRDTCSLPTLEAEPPITQIRRQELFLPRLEQARLMMAWTGPGLDSLEPVDSLRSACGLDLLAALLGEGRSSRLVQELREDRRLVQDIHSSFSLQRDSSLFTLTAWLEPEDVDRVEAIVCDRLSSLTSLPILGTELDRCKRLISNDFIFSTEMPGQLAGLYGYYNTVARAELAMAYPALIQSLQAEELQSLASRYLSPYHYAATILKPES